MKKRVLSFLLALVMLLSLAPAVFAANDNMPDGDTLLASGGPYGSEITISRNAAGDKVTLSNDTNDTDRINFVIYADGYKPADLDNESFVDLEPNHEAGEVYNASGVKLTHKIHYDLVTNNYSGAAISLYFPSDASGIWHIWGQNEWGTSAEDSVTYTVTLESGKIVTPKTTITFNVNGGTYDGEAKDLVVEVTPSTAESTNTVTISTIVPAGTFDRDGYELVGWHTDKTLTTALTTVDALTEGSNVDLYAIWKLKTVKITGKVGEALSNTVLAEGAADSKYTLTGMPAGITFDDTTRTVSGTPTASTKASGENGVAEATYTIADVDGNPISTTTVTFDIAKGDQDVPDIIFGTIGATSFNVTIESGAKYVVNESSAAPDASALTVSSDGTEQTIPGSAGKTYYVHAYMPGNDNYNPSTIENKPVTLGKLTTSIAFASGSKTEDVYSASGVAFPTVEVKDNDGNLLNTNDYSVVWTNKSNTQVANATDVGTYTATVTITNTDTYSQPDPDTLTFEITSKPLTITWDNAVFADMYYNGKTKTDVADPTSGAPTLSDGATPVITYTRAHSDANDAVTVKAEITDFTVAGNKANYKLPENGLTNENVGTVKVERQPVVVTDGTYTVSKGYDGTTDPGTPGGALGLEDFIEGEAVSLKAGYTPGAYDTPDINTGKTVTVGTLELTGEDSKNYVLNATTYQFTKAEITKGTVTVVSTNFVKFYNGDTDLEAEDVAAAELSGVADSEDVKLTIANANGAKYSQSGVGTNISITGNFALTGADADKYTLTQPTGLKGAIDRLVLNISVTNLEKPYSGEDNTLSEANKKAILDELKKNTVAAKDIDNNVLTLNLDAVTYPYANVSDYADYTAMSGTPALSAGTSGDTSGNYTFSAELKGKITKADQVLTTENEGDSLYYGETLQLVVTGKENPTLNYSVTSGTAAEVSTAGLVTTKGTGAVVITVTSNETANYKAGSLVINLTVGNKKDLTVTGISNKEITYGADFAVSDFIDSQITITDGDVTLTANDYTFDWDTAPATSTAGKINHGTYTATVKLDGTAASQYNLDGTTTVTLTVNQRPISIATENGKEIKKYYDGDTDLEAENETAINSLLKESDKISVGGNTDNVSLKLDNAKFSGTGNVVNGLISGITLDGTDANNYALTANVVGIIEAREITLPADAEIYKYYDTKADIGTSYGTTYEIEVAETGETVKVTINSGNYNQPDVTASSFEVTGYTLEVDNQTTQNYYLKSPSIIEEASIKPATMKDIDIKDITATYGDDNKTIELTGTVPAESFMEYSVVKYDDEASETAYGVVDSDYAEVVVNTNQVKIKNAVGAETVMVMVKITNPNYEIYYASGSLTISKKEVELDTEYESLGTTINSPVDLTGIKPFIVGIGDKNLTLGDDYDVTYSLVEDTDTTGLAMDGASSTTAPTAKGKAKFKVEATLKGESNTKNYNLITDEVTFDVNVGDGLFKIVFYRNDGTETTTTMADNAIGVAVTLKPNMDLTRDGYVFKGWATGENTGVVYDEAEEANVTFNKNYKDEALVDGGEVRLYAVWADAYKLTVNAGVGGTAATGSGSYEAGTKVNIGVTVNDSDYVFKAWEVNGTVNDLDPTKNEQEITMPGEAVELTATFKAKLKITPQTAISKKSSEASKIKVSDFIADAAPRLDDDKVKDLFTAAPAAAGTPGEFEGNGVTITFYTDNTYTVQSDITAIPTSVGTYYYIVAVKADADNTPTDKYILQKLDTPVNGILTITKSSSTGGGGGGGTPSSYVVTYDAGENGRLSAGDAATEKVSAGKAPVNIPDVIADDGYKFLGWSKDGENVIDLSKETVTKNTTYTALYAPYGFSDGVNHQHYMIGRAEDTFAPMGELTRVEAATMLARLTPGFSEDGSYSPSDFGDVSADHWANKYISFAQAEGIINGYENEDGTYSFNPDAPVTRAEFSAMIVRFKNISQQDESRFEDVAGHWAEGYIAALVDAGIIGGYEDGTFRPDRTINRAEATKIVNGAVGRTPDESIDLIDAGYNNKFSDVNVNDWFFHHVMEASLDHPAEDFH